LTRIPNQTTFLRGGEPRIISGEQTLNESLKSWLGEVTTGHGVAVLASTLLAVLSGTTTWAAAAPFLLAGLIGLVWPENTALQTAAQAAATDVTGMVTAFNGEGPTPAPAAKRSARRRQAE
jgi:hypothetical protein